MLYTKYSRLHSRGHLPANGGIGNAAQEARTKGKNNGHRCSVKDRTQKQISGRTANKKRPARNYRHAC